MSDEKFSPQLLRSVLQSQGIDMDSEGGSSTHSKQPDGPPSGRLTAFERREALRQLTAMISRFRSSSGNAAEVVAFRLEKLPQILRLLAELVAETRGSSANREQKKKVLHVAAAMLRRMLHMPDATHYRVLGLYNGATPEQIEEHYQLLHTLFWFDETIDPQRKSRLRISEAYTTLKDPESRYRYDEDLAWLEQQALRSVTSGGSNGWWGVAVALLLGVLGGVAAYLYWDRQHPQTVASPTRPPEQMQMAERGATEMYSPGESTAPDPQPLSQEEPSAGEGRSALQHEDVAIPSPEASTALEPPATEAKTGRASLPTDKRVAAKARRSPAGEASPVLPRKKARQKRESSAVGRGEVVPSPTPATTRAKHRPTVPTRLPRVTDVSGREFTEVVPRSRPSPHAAKGVETVRSIPQSTVTLLDTSPISAGKPKQAPTMVVIGSPSLSLDHLSKEQVQAIFLGRADRLPTGEPVTLVSGRGGSLLKEQFYREVIGKTPRQLKIHWAKIRFQGRQHPPQFLTDDEEVKERVARSPGVIGIIKSTMVDDSVKVLLRPRLSK